MPPPDSIRPSEPVFECPNCGARSYNPNDIRERYCGRCHEFFTTDPLTNKQTAETIDTVTAALIEGVIAKIYGKPRKVPSDLDDNEAVQWFRGYDA
jgi:hypothetical protein